MRKLFLFLLLISLGANSSTIDAFSFNPNCIAPYIGLAGGATYLPLKYEGINSQAGNRQTSTHRTGGLIGGVVGAQTYFCNNVYLGVQVNAFYDTTNERIRSERNAQGVLSLGVNVRNPVQWGMDFRIGKEIKGYTPYIFTGFECAHWKLTLRNRTGTTNAGLLPFSSKHARSSFCAPKVGTGITFPISCRFNLNVEYSYTWFGTESRHLNDTITGRWNHRLTINENSVILGVNFFPWDLY